MTVKTASHLHLVVTHVTKGMLVANLASKGVKAVGETGLSIEMLNEKGTFFVPQPLVEDKYYTAGQLDEIEGALGVFSVEIHPIDYNLC